jgi:hypothetical protein
VSLPLPVEDVTAGKLQLNDTLSDGGVVVAPPVDHTDEGFWSVVVRYANGERGIRTFDTHYLVRATRWLQPIYAGSRESRHWED